MAVKALVKYYRKKYICNTYVDNYAFIAFAEFQDSNIFHLKKVYHLLLSYDIYVM